MASDGSQLPPGWPLEDPDGPLVGGCPPGPHYAPALSSDGGHDEVSQAAVKAGELAPEGPWCPGR